MTEPASFKHFRSEIIKRYLHTLDIAITYDITRHPAFTHRIGYIGYTAVRDAVQPMR